MIVKLHTQGLQTFEQIQAFIEGSQALGFELTDRGEAYDFVAQTLRRFGYPRCSRRNKGLLRAYHVFGDARFERLAAISNGHLYNLRASSAYQRRRGRVDKTRPTPQVAIGERRKPTPQGRPGYLRVDSVVSVSKSAPIPRPEHPSH